MNEADALDIVQAAIWTVIVASGPAVLAAMIVGVVIAFIQALTQVQEMTLTFVPKILAVMITVAISAPFIGAQISIFTDIVFSRIQSDSDCAFALPPSRKLGPLSPVLDWGSACECCPTSHEETEETWHNKQR